MKTVLEFSYKCEVIEKREYEGFFVEPQIGERLRLECENPNTHNEYGFWWIVKERIHLFAPVVDGKKMDKHVLTLYIEPDLKDGIPQNDPLYKDYIRDEN